MINKRFSILHALCLVFICSVVFAVINWLGPLTDRAQELNRVHQWAQQIERAEDEDRFHSIAVSFDGKQFGISTHVKSQSFGGWTYDNGRRAKRYFVYPPGKEVDSIEAAFSLADREIPIEEKVSVEERISVETERSNGTE